MPTPYKKLIFYQNPMFDTSTIKDEKAKIFINNFLMHRNVNREFFKRLTGKQFDYRMTKKSDSPRESLAHQIGVQRCYMNAVEKGELRFGNYKDNKLRKMSKKELMVELDKTDKELMEILSDKDKLGLKIKVPWDRKTIDPVSMFWALSEHEILHTGWNIAIMDHLGMERFEALKKVWG
jgi:uncharacterized damage-inducible protein DinB